MCVGEPAIASNDDLEPHNGLLFAGPGLDSPTHKWQEAAPGALKRSRAAMVSGDWSTSVAAIERHEESKFAVVMRVTY